MAPASGLHGAAGLLFATRPSGLTPDLALAAGRQSAWKAKQSAFKLLAVADFADGFVVVFDNKYRARKTIGAGLSATMQGDWYDADGNFYVTNEGVSNVVEYAPGTRKPTFTYSTGLEAASAVTTDAGGNVYVADYVMGVEEFTQGQNVVATACSVPGGAVGVAVDASGDVFVAVNDAGSGSPGVREYAGGLKGCVSSILGVRFTGPYAGELQVDRKGNLVVADYGAGTVDIVVPPYASISRRITGFTGPFTVALNKQQTLLFVADPGIRDLVVDEYPSGTNVTTLGYSNGIPDPLGVAVY